MGVARTAVCTVVATVLIGAGAAASGPAVVVLQETGRTRDGLPVLAPSPDQEPYRSVLQRGLSGELVRLWPRVQACSGSAEPEPAYLLLSSNQGGFPRTGFFLSDTPKRGVGFVDLHGGRPASGVWGVADQMFPHELWHLVLDRLAGEATGGGSNQVHAVGVRTDRETAFNEGVAEALQVLAVDDPGAEPGTRALPADAGAAARAAANLAGLERELSATVAVAGRYRMTFPLWFSPTEQVLRYHAVKANLFARAPAIPVRALRPGDPWDALVLDGTLPGTPGCPPRPPGRLLATEGVVAAFAVRWLASSEAQRLPRDRQVVGRWGLDDVRPGVGVALAKLCEAVRAGRVHTLPELVASWRRVFPEDGAALDAALDAALLGQSPPRAPELWLATASPVVGTSLFDQWRGVRRAHTFDLNAADEVDLLAVPGVDRAVAAALRAGAPYASVADVSSVRAVPAAVVAELEAMVRTMAALRTAPEEALSLSAILMPYLWRALAVLLLVAMAATALHLAPRGSFPLWRAALDGFGTALVGLVVGWLVDPGTGLLAWVAPTLLFGVPAAGFALRRSPREAGRALAAWALAALPVLLVVRPWF